MPYHPIKDHGIIGNMRTVALVSKTGAIDWLCYPRFDSPTVFARILDDDIGGTFQLHPAQQEDVTYRQFYWPETNVLVTRFICDQGVSEIRDFMPINRDGTIHRSQVIRQVIAVRGDIPFTLRCAPAFDYARGSHETYTDTHGARFVHDDQTWHLETEIPLKRTESAVEADFTVKQGHRVTFAFYAADGRPTAPMRDAASEAAFNNTVIYWRRWLSLCTYKGRWRDQVFRSALALKLLTYEPTGAIVASPTMGLPEHLGGERNWDYRYVWIRDAAFTLYGFMRIGFTQEAAAFMSWLMDRTREADTPVGPLQPLYGISGETEIEETRLDHLSGYKNSRPVRLGNAAYKQPQLDIYGELMDAVYLYNKYGERISYDLWSHLRPMLDWVCDNWQREDEGIWEVRGEKRHLVYSRLMCWVALDRGMRLAEKRSFPAPMDRWRTERDAIYEEVMAHGWSEELQAFKQSYEVEALDASTLIMPLVFFMAPSDPRMLKTIDAILKPPEDGGLTEDSLVYRYNPALSDDGLEGKEGTFNMCTFWLVEALTRAGQHDRERLDHARLLFERMLGYANHLGLYAEETGQRDNALGNFPQAFTHLALISAAFNLDRVLNG